MQTSLRGSGEVSATQLKYQYEYCSSDVNGLQHNASGFHQHQLDAVTHSNESHCKQDELYQLRTNFVVFERDQTHANRIRNEHCELQPVADQQNILTYDPTSEASHRYTYEQADINYHSVYSQQHHRFEPQLPSHNSEHPNQAANENPNSTIVIYHRQQSDTGTSGTSAICSSGEVEPSAPLATYYELANFNENQPIQLADTNIGRQVSDELYDNHSTAETPVFTCPNEHLPNQAQYVQQYATNTFDPSDTSTSNSIYQRTTSAVEYQSQPMIYNAPVPSGYTSHSALVAENNVPQECDPHSHLLPVQDHIDYQQLDCSKLSHHESERSFIPEHCPDLQPLNCVSAAPNDSTKTPAIVVEASTYTSGCEDEQTQKRCLRSAITPILSTKAPSSSSSRSSYSESESSMSSTMTRDEKRAREANIPMSWYEIVNLSIEQFNEKLTKFTLTESQLTLIKDIRRRGKNKVAAQSCRKRKMEQIFELQHEVENLVDKKRALIDEKQQLIREHSQLVQRYDRIQAIIQQQLQRRQVQNNPVEQYSCI